jgi:hypothetical protein
VAANDHCETKPSGAKKTAESLVRPRGERDGSGVPEREDGNVTRRESNKHAFVLAEGLGLKSNNITER